MASYIFYNSRLSSMWFTVVLSPKGSDARLLLLSSTVTIKSFVLVVLLYSNTSLTARFSSHLPFTSASLESRRRARQKSCVISIQAPHIVFPRLRRCWWFIFPWGRLFKPEWLNYAAPRRYPRSQLSKQCRASLNFLIKLCFETSWEIQGDLRKSEYKPFFCLSIKLFETSKFLSFYIYWVTVTVSLLSRWSIQKEVERLLCNSVETMSKASRLHLVTVGFREKLLSITADHSGHFSE